jgi:hypothetical protein
MRSLRVTLAVVLSGIVWIGGAGGTAAACSCGQLTNDGALKLATDVFIGRLEVIDDSAEFDQPDRVLYVMAVDGVVKGEAYERQAVVTSQRGGACGAEMTIDSSYAIFAIRRNGDELFTSLCSGNRLASVEAIGDSLGTVGAPITGDGPGLTQLGMSDPVENRARAVMWSGALLVAMAGIAVAGVVLGRRSRRDGPPGSTMEP